MQLVVSFALKRMAMKREGLHLGARYLDTGRVGALVEFSFDPKASSGAGVANQIDNDLKATQRFTPLILGDVAEQPMLNLVPLAGSRWKVADTYLQMDFVGKFL